jgi:hypothetical protein
MLHPRFALIAFFLLPIVNDDPPKSKWVRSLPYGVTVELLGICDPASGEWWTPDGTALAEPICRIFDFGADRNMRQRGFAVRVKGPDINATVQWIFDPYSGGQGGSAVKDGEMLPGVRWQITGFPTNLHRASVSLKVAGTPWVTAATYRYSFVPDVVSKERTVSFCQPRVTEKGISMVVVEDHVGFDAQLLAFGKDGKALSSTGSTGANRIFCVHDQEFRVDKLEKIERFELQVRPIEAVEFKNVPLDAPKP